MRDAEERRDRKEWHRSVVTTSALGGSASLIIGSIVASLNPVVALFAIVPLIGGIVIGGSAYFGASLLERERSLYKQIADRLAAIVKELR
jgi:hypothetical protein